MFEAFDVNRDAKLTVEEYTKSMEAKRTFDDILASDLKWEAQVTESVKEIFEEATELVFEGFHKAYEKIRGLLKKLKEVKTTETPKTEEEDDGFNEEETSEPEEDTEDIAEESKTDLDDPDEPQRPPHNEATQALIDAAKEARKEYEEILDKVTRLENGIREAENFIGFEYGDDHSWAPLKGQCAELTTSQYTYKLCLFDRSLQKGRNDHSEVNLGYWGHWDGLEGDKFCSQKYDNGQTCWNGPARSTHVDIVCGEELQVVEASEPNKCEYRFLLKSPAACQNPADTKQEHEEL